MKKIFVILSIFALSLTLIGCGKDKPDPKPDPDPDPEETVLSVKEVLEQEDLTYVEFEGIVIGHDLGMRHMIIEDLDGSATVQIYKNPGFIKARVGDKVLVKGYRTYDRSVDRVAPESLEILSSGNTSSYDNPVVINGDDLVAWTNENRTNPNILFKVYQFNNVVIKSASTSYTYIDDMYDEEGGRGLKIGIKNDSSVYAADNFVIGQKYNIKAVLYGISDDFYDEALEGTVLRLSVMAESDIEVINDGEDALVLVNGQRSFLVSDNATKPDFTTYFSVVDPVDGPITVTSDMIEENVDLTKEGTYDVKLTFRNSEYHTTVYTTKIYVTEAGRPVTDAINAEINSDLHVRGVVIGYSLRSNGTKNAVIIEDPTNGNAIEFWAPDSSSNFNDIKVGDEVLLYSGKISPEKGLPRLRDVVLLGVLSENNALTAPRVIEDVAAYAEALATDQSNFFGRITFTGTMVETGSSYNYFVRNKDGKVVQVAIHGESTFKYNWVVGETYEITALVYGVSDPFTALETKSIVVRLGIMNEEDIKVITETPEEPEDPEEPTEQNKTVTDAIAAAIGEEITFEGVVLGYGVNSTGYKSAMILSNPENGDSIELWLNKTTVFDNVVVGDKLLVKGTRAVEKDYPRLTNYTLIETISSGNELPAPRVIEDVALWTEQMMVNHDGILGRYQFTAQVVNVTTSYVYFTYGGETGPYILQFAIHQDQSVYKHNWVVGETYEVVAVLYGISDSWDKLATKHTVTRFGIMNETDVKIILSE